MEWNSFHDALLVNAAIDNDLRFIVVKDKVPGNRTAKECKERFEYLKAIGKATKIHTTPPKPKQITLTKSSPIIKRQRKSKDVAHDIKGNTYVSSHVLREIKSQSSPVKKIIAKPPKKLKAARGFNLQSPRKIAANIPLPQLANIAPMTLNANNRSAVKFPIKFQAGYGNASMSPKKFNTIGLKREVSPNNGYHVQKISYPNISLPPSVKMNPARFKPNQSPARTSWHTKRIQPMPKPPLVNTSPSKMKWIVKENYSSPIQKSFYNQPVSRNYQTSPIINKNPFIQDPSNLITKTLQIEDFFKPEEKKELNFDDLFCFDGCESEKGDLSTVFDLQSTKNQDVSVPAGVVQTFSGIPDTGLGRNAEFSDQGTLPNLYNTLGGFSNSQFISEPTIEDLLGTNNPFQTFNQNQYYCQQNEKQTFNDQLLSSFAQPESITDKGAQQDTAFWEDLFATPKQIVKNRKKLDNESETDIDIKITRHEVDELFLEAEEFEEPVVLEEIQWIGRKEDGFSVTQINTLKEQLSQCFQLIVQGYCIEKQLNHSNQNINKFWADELVRKINIGSIW